MHTFSHKNIKVHPEFFVLKISEKFVHIRGPFSSHELTRTNTKKDTAFCWAAKQTLKRAGIP